MISMLLLTKSRSDRAARTNPPTPIPAGNAFQESDVPRPCRLILAIRGLLKIRRKLNRNCTPALAKYVCLTTHCGTLTLPVIPPGVATSLAVLATLLAVFCTANYGADGRTFASVSRGGSDCGSGSRPLGPAVGLLFLLGRRFLLGLRLLLGLCGCPRICRLGWRFRRYRCGHAERDHKRHVWRVEIGRLSPETTGGGPPGGKAPGNFDLSRSK
jgi:hypothetical protein